MTANAPAPVNPEALPSNPTRPDKTIFFTIMPRIGEHPMLPGDKLIPLRLYMTTSKGEILLLK